MLSAQINSDKGWFTADFDAGCTPFGITIEHTGVRSGSLFIDFFGDPADPFSGSGFSETFVAGETRTNDGSITPQYTMSGTYLIRVVDQSGTGSNADRFDFLEVTVTAPSSPIYTIGLCNNNQVLLTFDFQGDTYDFYEIDFGDGMPPTIFDKTGANTLNYAYGAEATYTINVSGRLNNGANTTCGAASPVTVTTLQNITNPVIHSMTVLDANSLQFTYDPLIDNLAYGLYQSENGGPFVQVATLPPETNREDFEFASAQANVDYNFGQFAFRIIAIEACSGTAIESVSMQNIRAGYMAAYNDNIINLDRMWNTQDPDGLLTNVEMVYDGVSETVAVATSGTSTLNLNSCTEAAPFYFEATFNGALSRSVTITPDLSMNSLSPVAPTGLAGQIGGGSLQLTFDTAPFTASEYRVYQLTDNGRQLEQSTTGLSVTINDFALSDSEVCFVFTYVDECGHESLPSEPLCFRFTPSIVLPNAFSPNDDDANDTFGVPSGIFLNFRMEIYNQWGSLVFVSNDAATGWDGRVNGQPAPIGGYVYKINYNSGQGSPVSLTGSFVLIR